MDSQQTNSGKLLHHSGVKIVVPDVWEQTQTDRLRCGALGGDVQPKPCPPPNHTPTSCLPIPQHHRPDGPHSVALCSPQGTTLTSVSRPVSSEQPPTHTHREKTFTLLLEHRKDIRAWILVHSHKFAPLIFTNRQKSKIFLNLVKIHAEISAGALFLPALCVFFTGEVGINIFTFELKTSLYNK